MVTREQFREMLDDLERLARMAEFMYDQGMGTSGNADVEDARNALLDAFDKLTGK